MPKIASSPAGSQPGSPAVFARHRHNGIKVAGRKRTGYIPNPSIMRLANRAGIKSLRSNAYDEVRNIIRLFLDNVLKDASFILINDKKKTLTKDTTLYCLERHGIKLYGV